MKWKILHLMLSWIVLLVNSERGKISHFLSNLHDSISEQCFDLIHSDVRGITPIISHSHYKYFVTFIDDHSPFTWIIFLRAKSKVFGAFKKNLAYIENQFSTCMKTFRSNSGGEYVSHQFQKFLQDRGIIYLNVLFRMPPNKMVWLNGRIVIYLMWFVVFYLNPPSHLVFYLKH